MGGESSLKVAADRLALLRSGFDAYVRSDIEGAVAPFHPDVEFRLIGGFEGLMGGEFIGHAGVRDFFEDWLATAEVLEAGFARPVQVGDKVLLEAYTRSRVRLGQAESDLRWAAVYEFRDGLVYRADNYYDRSEALTALGLESWPE